MTTTHMHPYVLRGLAVIVALAGSTACKTYRTTTQSAITPQRDIQVRFSSPVSLHLACDSAGAADSACLADSRAAVGVLDLSGRFERTEGDSMLVRISALRDTLNGKVRYDPPRAAWLRAQSAVIAERHTSASRTVLLVVALTASAVAVVAVANAASFGANPGPKPSASPKFF